MVIQEKKKDGRLLLAVSGKLDTSTAPELDKIIEEKKEEIKELILDFSGLEYICSSGLRILLKTCKYMNHKGGSMVVRGARGIVRNTFFMTGFLERLDLDQEEKK